MVTSRFNQRRTIEHAPQPQEEFVVVLISEREILQFGR